MVDEASNLMSRLRRDGSKLPFPPKRHDERLRVPFISVQQRFYRAGTADKRSENQKRCHLSLLGLSVKELEEIEKQIHSSLLQVKCAPLNRTSSSTLRSPGPTGRSERNVENRKPSASSTSYENRKETESLKCDMPGNRPDATQGIVLPAQRTKTAHFPRPVT